MRKTRTAKNQPIVLNYNFQVDQEKSSEWDSEISIEESNDVLEMSKYFQEVYLKSFCDLIAVEIVNESCREMVSASLVLFSSSILDKYITEVLALEIHKIAYQAYQEINDSEYLDFQLAAINDALEELLYESALQISSEYLSVLISSTLSDDLNLAQIAQDSLDEEHS